MPRPTIVTPDDIPARKGARTRSSAQKVVDAYVTEALPMLADLPTDGTGVLLHFTAEDDPGFSFSGATQSSLKDRCRRMLRLSMKDIVPPELDEVLSTTYEVSISKGPDEAFVTDGFKAYIVKEREPKVAPTDVDQVRPAGQ